jgi:[NiFe] hydrogenase diaphorase moiety large subunit
VIPAAFGNRLTFAEVATDEAFARALAMPCSQIITELSTSQLNEHGPAVVGVRWSLAAADRGDAKLVVCNAHEAKPGAFKNRVILSEHADLVFAGMTIAGYAIGAPRGILYLREEHAYLRERLQHVLAERRKRGLLGKSVTGRPTLAFDIEIHFCSRNGSPFQLIPDTERWPVITNSAETFAWVTCIVGAEAAWSQSNRAVGSTISQILSVSGDCTKPGVYEIPRGASIAELLALAGGETARAVQIGGASGDCVPSEEFHRSVASVNTAGSGAVVVFGPGRDMLELARSFVERFVEEPRRQPVEAPQGSCTGDQS